MIVDSNNEVKNFFIKSVEKDNKHHSKVVEIDIGLNNIKLSNKPPTYKYKKMMNRLINPEPLKKEDLKDKDPSSLRRLVHRNAGGEVTNRNNDKTNSLTKVIVINLENERVTLGKCKISPMGRKLYESTLFNVRN